MAQRYSVSESVHVEIRGCRDRVSVVGWDEAKTVSVDRAARQDGDTIVIENSSRVSVRVPRGASVTISGCEADVSIRDITGRVELAGIEGDVALTNLTAEASVRDLEGDLAARGVAALKGEGAWEGDVSARGVHGSLTLDSIEGDLNVRMIEGDLKVVRVDGDLIVSGTRGAIEAPEVNGDAILSLAAVATVRVRAEGDVVLNLPADANAELELDAPQGDLVARLNLKTTEHDENHLRGTLGTGGPRIEAESIGGDLILSENSGDKEHAEYSEYAAYGDYAQYADLGQQISEKVKASVDQALDQAGIRSQGRHRHFGPHFGERSQESDSRGSFEEKPRGPAAGTPERQAILDAIARGEMSVDEAIKKLGGEA